MNALTDTDRARIGRLAVRRLCRRWTRGEMSILAPRLRAMSDVVAGYATSRTFSMRPDALAKTSAFRVVTAACADAGIWFLTLEKERAKP